MRRVLFTLLIFSSLAMTSCNGLFPDKKNDLPEITSSEIKAGGTTTVFDNSSQAFSTPAPNLTDVELQKHTRGDKNFESIFVTPPAVVHGGLGPLFDDNSCASCHVNDGGGKPFLDNGQISSVLIRVSSNATEQPGAPIPVDGFGTQIQHKAVTGVQPEAEVTVHYDIINDTLTDGTIVKLHKPTYQLNNSYKPVPPGTRLSVRTAPPVFGVGLLEAIPESDILKNADPDDQDGDGISGKPNYVPNDSTGTMELGRFGWKANEPTVLQQTAIAYNQDMGITSPYYPKENIDDNPQAEDGLNDDPEISWQILDETAFYAMTLGVPSRRNTDNPMVRLGKKIFLDAKCESCHTPKHITATDFPVQALRNQTIYPYTDLLLHDMGEGLADHRSDYQADGKEWRTAPLWGIGLSETVNGPLHLLHDGRARSLLEAILWHGGEAKTSKEYVEKLDKKQRDALIDFLRSL